MLSIGRKQAFMSYPVTNYKSFSVCTPPIKFWLTIKFWLLSEALDFNYSAQDDQRTRRGRRDDSDEWWRARTETSCPHGPTPGGNSYGPRRGSYGPRQNQRPRSPWTRPPGPLLSYCDYSLLSFDIYCDYSSYCDYSLLSFDIHVQILLLPDSSSKYCR